MAEYTDPQVMAFLKMGDLSTQEKLLAQQQAQAQQLRNLGMQPSSKKDWASQASRALQGFGGMMAQKQYKEGMGTFSNEKQGVMNQLAEILGAGGKKVPRDTRPLPLEAEDVPPGGPW